MLYGTDDNRAPLGKRSSPRSTGGGHRHDATLLQRWALHLTMHVDVESSARFTLQSGKGAAAPQFCSRDYVCQLSSRLGHAKIGQSKQRLASQRNLFGCPAQSAISNGRVRSNKKPRHVNGRPENFVNAVDAKPAATRNGRTRRGVVLPVSNPAVVRSGGQPE